MCKDRVINLSVKDTDGTPWPNINENLAGCIDVREESGCYRPDFPRVQRRSSPKVNSERSSKSFQIDSTVSLNVGGAIFRTSSSTLKKTPFFESMLRHVETGGLSTTVDECGRFFIDRSGELFGYILEYLRTGHWLLREHSRDLEFIEALREEAAFYGLDDNNHLPQPQVSEYVTIWQFDDDTALYVDCLGPTIREDPDYQGLFRFCKYSGGMPLEQQTCTKRFKAYSHSIQAVIAYFALRGFSLMHVLDGKLMTHTTSAEGQSRTGPSTQYVLSRLRAFPNTGHAITSPSERLLPELCGGIHTKQTSLRFSARVGPNKRGDQPNYIETPITLPKVAPPWVDLPGCPQYW